MIRAIVFDLDGVLIKPWRFRAALEREYGIGPELTSSFFDGPFKECSVGKLDLRRALAPFLDTWGWQHSIDDFLRLWFEADAEIDSDVLALVRRMRSRGHRVYVASTQEPLRARYLTTNMGLASEFDALYYSCDFGVMKPDPRFFTLTSEAMGLSGTDLLFFDDDPTNVVAARSVGWHAEHFVNHNLLERRLATVDSVISERASETR